MSGENSETKKVLTCPDIVNIKISDQELEKLEVAQLNCEIEERSKPSELFEKLREKRKMLHENAIKRYNANLHEVNLKAEKSIKLSSMDLKAHIKEFENKLRVKLKNFDNPEAAKYCPAVFNEMQNTAIEYKKQQQKLVNEFYEDLTHFENKRAKRNAELLHVTSEEIRKIGYLLPYDIQTFVEGETLKMNQLSLSNRRCYEDLKLTLTLVTEQTLKSFVDNIFCIRENWIQRKAHENCYTAPIGVDEEVKNFPKSYSRLELKGHELPLRVNQSGHLNVCTEEEWLNNVRQILSILDDSRKNLVELHKKTIRAVYGGFSSDIEEIKSGMGLIEGLILEERVIKPLLIETKTCHPREGEEMELHWQTSLEDIRYQLKLVKEFVKEIAKLWDAHEKRVCESKRLILKAMEKAEQKDQVILQDLEIKLNLALDALRQEHNQSKLEKNYENVVAILNELRARYESMYLDGASIIEDFHKMMTLESNVLMTDVNEFMIETSSVKFAHGFAGQFRYLKDIDLTGESIFKDIKTCTQQIQNMKFWKQGVWIAFENVSGKTAEYLQLRGQGWIKSRIKILAEKKTIQLEILSKRFKRIHDEIYEKRLGELKEHQEMFDSHKEKILLSLKKAKEDLQKLVENRTLKINEIEKNLTELENNVLPVNIAGIIRGNKITTERRKVESEKELQFEFEKFRAYCETRMSDNQQVNINFMKSIKLFHEGGNYSTEEAAFYMNLLEAVDREITTEIKSIMKDSTKEEHELLKRMTTIFNPTITLLTHLHEEVKFYQDVQQRIQNLTTQIQDSVRALKQDFDILKEHYDCVKKYVEGTPGSIVDVSEDQLWNFLTQLLYKNIGNLLYPLQLAESSAESAEGEEKEIMGEYSIASPPCCCAGKYSLQIKNSKSFRQSKSGKADSLSCQDFERQLFNCEVPLKDDDTFVGNMNKNFSEEFTSIEKEACEFYKKIQGRQIIRKDLLPDTYENFVEATLKRFRHYGTQIQQFWLKALLDFLPVLGKIKLLINDFLTRKLNCYQNSAITALKTFEAHFKDCIDFQNCENLKEFDELDKKLLPLYGYPQNEHLLNGLQETVVARIASLEVKWDLGFKNFKSNLKCFRFRHVEQKFEIKKIELQFIKLRDNIFIDELGYNLLEELLNICVNGGFCKKNTSKNNFMSDKETGNDAENANTEDVPKEHQLDLQKKKFSPIKDYLQKLRQIIEKENFPKVKSSKFLLPREGTFDRSSGEDLSRLGKLNILLDIMDFGTHTLTALEKIEQYIRHLKGFAEFQEKLHEEDLFKWLSRWKFNVKKILKLYRNKCPENPPLLGQPVNGE